MSAAQARGRPKPAGSEDVVNGIEPLGGQSLEHKNRLKPRLLTLATSGWADLLAWLSLALAGLAICWPLGLTNRVLAGIDAFTYFLPYWDYRMAALRAGELPLWNPYLFLGVPFLANPQAAVLYPLHWPLSWLTAERALVWSALLHAWLAAGFTYTFARRSFGLTRPAAWLAGLVFGLGGFTLARIENINQLNALAWLPALLWLYEETLRAGNWPRRVRWGVALSLVIALQMLAGHTQTTFINLAGLGLYALAHVQWRRLMRSEAIAGAGIEPSGGLPLRGNDRLTLAPALRSGANAGEPRFLVITSAILRPFAPLLTIIPALLLSAAQLLPTLELNGLGLRTGGLPFRQAISFSLRPRLLAQTLLPPFGGGLAEAFASEGYAEFVGYVGLAALALAGLALWRAWGQRSGPAAGLRIGGPLLLTVAGLFLALGAYNPVYYLLWRFVPGFDLFRAPARWLALFAVGVAVLAGMGLDVLQTRPGGAAARPRGSLGGNVADRLKPLFQGGKRRFSLIIAGLFGLALIALQQPPPWPTLAGWAVAALLAGGLLWAARRWPSPARAGLILLALLELWGAGRALPFTQATAPLAASLRNAPAALLAAAGDQSAAGRDRFLSLSDIRFDPGDLAELRTLQADRLPTEAVERMVRAAKQVEVIAPNLSLRYRLPAVDGYDGGLLPLGRYVELQGLFLPADQLVPDGRLREQLPAVPADRLLDLTGVRFVITDKQRDLWADDIYYDLELPAPLAPGATLALDLSGYPAFPATALGVVAEAWGEIPNGTSLAEVSVTAADGSTMTLRLLSSAATGASPRPERLALPRSAALTRLTLTALADGPGVTIHGLSLLDERTAAHATVTISPRGDFRRIHTGDVKVYERTAAAGRAWLTHGVRPVADDEAALAILADPTFDPRASTVVAADLIPTPAAFAGPDESVNITSAHAEQLTLRVQVTSPALLVLADTFYPGWEATVDGAPAPILRANLLFRGVALTPGAHEVIFTYRLQVWWLGVWISVVMLGLLTILILAAWGREHTAGPRLRTSRPTVV